MAGPGFGSSRPPRSTCEACHTEQTPVQGPGHRAIPRCADCHTIPQTHHDPAIGTKAECSQCHTPHGSPNLNLVSQAINPPNGAPQPITFTNRQGKADGSFASASDPGSGVCEVCHTSTKYYRSDAQGAAHYSASCPLCHKHAQGFEIIVPPSASVYGECALCHTPIADSLYVYRGHGSYDLKCESCHVNLKPGEYGPAHRAVPSCTQCHTEPQTHHDPAIDTTAFPGTVSSPYWSSTPSALTSGTVWAINFSTGTTSAADGGTGYWVRCVR